MQSADESSGGVLDGSRRTIPYSHQRPNSMGLTQRQLAEGIRLPNQRVNELVNGRRVVTPHTDFGWQSFSAHRQICGRTFRCSGTCITRWRQKQLN